MSTVVRMPALAAGAAEAAIQSWLVAVGDEVSAGQAIVEIETEKAVVEYEAEAGGTLAGILVPQGEAAAVGAPIAVLAGPGQSAADALAEAGAAVGADTVDAPSASEPSAPDSAPAAPSAGAPASADTTSSRRLFASPLVRRLAKERGLDLDAITGSGPNGRIVRRDIDDLGPASAPAPAAATSAPAADTRTSAVAAYTDVPHTRMRRAIARRLTESTTTVPHFFLVADCRVDELLAVRARVNEGGAARISVNDFVLKAVASAMEDVPEANAIWTDDATRQFSGVDIAVAVSVPGGLVTPVVRGVDRLRLSELSRRVRELAERARDGRIGQAELEGGSFSVSNLGMYGTTEFSAIINPPHSGILAVGAATRRPVVGDDGELAVATVMTVTLSADHRVLDGALAAQWLDAFVRRIQNPLSMIV
ncbi:2-oxo acid dehydrogenase subunit E2 [Microbacterium sp. Root180]|uniref:2-oxo acid dehydrogenase subunit E2 n=1 Tax=Microbacterium sp. Root180 TaxID=1736483 RepID=UPI0006FA67A6|nr:2-oxo acid dehydrogenase subunit E2 [Microbacterium sp. Root180]KRB38884.1 branched-chain alpha-keto acid dehydrogenase subunit E2 [Microbacterium sp. Root180]